MGYVINLVIKKIVKNSEFKIKEVRILRKINK